MKKISLLNELLFVRFFQGPEMSMSVSILIIKQYFADCVFLAGLGLSWINKYDNKSPVGGSKSQF